MIIFPQNPVWFSLKLINELRKHEKCVYKPSIRQAISICKMILARFLNRGFCGKDDFIEIAIITSVPENQKLAQNLATKIIEEYGKNSSKMIGIDNINANLFEDIKSKDLLQDFDEFDMNELEEIFDDFSWLESNLDDDVTNSFDEILNSMKNNFFEKYQEELRQEPYKTALETLQENPNNSIEDINNLDDLLNKARQVLRDRIGQLEPEDIIRAGNMGMIDEILNESENRREQMCTNFLKSDDFDSFREEMKQVFNNNFYNGLNTLEFSLNTDLFNEDEQNELTELVKEEFAGSSRDLEDLLEASRVVGTNLDLDEKTIEKVIENSFEGSPSDAYDAAKNLDNYFGYSICEALLEKIRENLDDEDEKELLETLIEKPLKSIQWRQLVKDLIERNIDTIRSENLTPEAISSEMNSFSEDLISLKEKCIDLDCRFQLEDLISDVIEKTISNCWCPEDLKNSVENFRNLGYQPSTDNIIETGRRLNMSELEIMSIVSADFETIKTLIEENVRDYNVYNKILSQANLMNYQIAELVQLALNGNDEKKYNLDFITAIIERDLSIVLNTANSMGKKQLNAALSSLGAGDGLNLLKQWFFSRHNISPVIKNKLKLILKQIIIDLGIRNANALIGTANRGPLVENIVVPYNIGDDFELIDLEETINNILEAGKSIEMITEDDFLVMKTTQGLRNIVMELDISGSMAGEKLAQMALCASMLLYAFKPEEIALCFFESDTHILKNLNDKVELDEVADELLDIKAEGGTCISAALEWANLQFTKNSRTKYKLNVLFTDADVFDLENSLKELEKMKDKDVKFVMVVPQFDYSSVMAKKMVNEVNGTLLTLDQWKNFPKLISEIVSHK